MYTRKKWRGRNRIRVRDPLRRNYSVDRTGLLHLVRGRRSAMRLGPTKLPTLHLGSTRDSSMQFFAARIYVLWGKRHEVTLINSTVRTFSLGSVS